MDEAEKAQHRVYSSLMEARKALERASWKKTPLPAELSAEWAALPQAFEAALDDDLNTAQALGQIFSQVRIVNRLLEEKNLRAAESTRDLLEDFLARARDWDAQLGLFGRDPAEFLTELRAMRAARKTWIWTVWKICCASGGKPACRRILPAPTPCAGNCSTWA